MNIISNDQLFNRKIDFFLLVLLAVKPSCKWEYVKVSRTYPVNNISIVQCVERNAPLQVGHLSRCCLVKGAMSVGAHGTTQSRFALSAAMGGTLVKVDSQFRA